MRPDKGGRTEYSEGDQRSTGALPGRHSTGDGDGPHLRGRHPPARIQRVTGEVTDWIRAPQPYSYYRNGQSGTGNNYAQNTPGLLVDALIAFCQHDTLTRFDRDGDGYVDGIFLVHAGGGAEAEPDRIKRPNMIWSHKWVLPTPFSNGGVKVFAYSTEPEDGRVGVFAHEFGHDLGLPDLYDSTYRSAGIGDWCLMANGSWGGGGSTPVRLSAWCLAKLGWITPTVVSAAGTVTLDTLANAPNDSLRVWTGGKPGPEYFLLENKQKVGRDKALLGSGLAVWHIDETQSGNTNPLSYLVGLVQADGSRDLEFNRNTGEARDLFPSAAGMARLTDKTTPSSRANNGSPTGVALTAITDLGGTIRLRIKV
jgi:immune inhibitor A